MRLWVFTFQEKCPAGTIDTGFFRDLLRAEGIEQIEQVSKTTFVFQSKDLQDHRYWERLASLRLEPAFYYTILELKNSNCKPVGTVRLKRAEAARANSR